MTDTQDSDFFSDVPEQLRNNPSISASRSSPSQLLSQGPVFPPSQPRPGWNVDLPVIPSQSRFQPTYQPVTPSLPISQETKDIPPADQVKFQEWLRQHQPTALLFIRQPYEATLFPEHVKYQWKDVKTSGAGTGACGLDAVCITLGLPRDDPAVAAETYHRMRLMILHARIQIDDGSAEEFYSERMTGGCVDMDDIAILCMVKFGVIPIIIAPEKPMLFAEAGYYDNIRFMPKGERTYVIIQYVPPGHWICKGAQIEEEFRTLFFEDELPLQLKEEFFLFVTRNMLYRREF